MSDSNGATLHETSLITTTVNCQPTMCRSLTWQVQENMNTWATLGCLKASVLLWNSLPILLLFDFLYDTKCVAIFKPPPWSQSINSPPGFLFRPHIRLHSSLLHSSALIPALQWHPQAHLTRQLSGPGFITGRSSAGKVRYLTALTSWRGIYADDDSHCPLAILLLPPCRSVQSPDIDSIRIWLWSLSFLSLYHTSCFQKTSGSHLSPMGGLCRRIVSSFCSAKFIVTTDQKTGRKKFWVNYFDFGRPSDFLKGAY